MILIAEDVQFLIHIFGESMLNKTVRAMGPECIDALGIGDG